MNLYNNYCYADIDSAAQAEITAPVNVSSEGILTGQSYVVLTADTVNMVYHYSPVTGLPASNINHVRVFPTCTQIGYLTNVSGLTLPDVVELSFGVILIWVIAFVFRAMARPTGVRL